MAETTYKILAVERILKKFPYGITIDEILEILEKEYGVIAERKSVSANIYMLSRFMQIDRYTAPDHKVYWCVKEGTEND